MTYRQLLARLLDQRPWIDAQGVPTGQGSRFATLCNAVDFVDEAYRSGRVGELMDARTNPESIWGLVEATELEAALRRLRPLGPAGLPEVLRTALVGENSPARIPTTPDGEGESAVTRARNDVFQLVVGAHLSQIEGQVTFAEPDVTAPFGPRRLLTACKRPFSAKGLLERAEEGAGQIARHRDPRTDIGVLAMAADRILSANPGRLILESPSEAHAEAFLHEAIARGPLRAIEERLNAIEDQAVDVVIVQASVPAIIGGDGLNRFSQTAILLRAFPEDMDRAEFIERLKSCFRAM